MNMQTLINVTFMCSRGRPEYVAGIVMRLGALVVQLLRKPSRSHSRLVSTISNHLRSE